MKTNAIALQPGFHRLRQYLELTKPRVVWLIVFCAVIGMFLAVPGMVPWRIRLAGTVGMSRSRFAARFTSRRRHAPRSAPRQRRTA